MKKLLIITLLTITSLTLEAMQQAGQQAQDKVPKLYTMIINKVLEGSIDTKNLSKELQKYPETVRELIQEEIKKAFISSINQGEPKSQLDTWAGHITQFSDGSRRIDNYLGIGDTLYLSNDLQRYLHLNAQGDKVLSSLDKEFVKSSEPYYMYYKLPQGISSTYNLRRYINEDLDTEKGPFLSIYYPCGFAITFKAGLDYPYPTLPSSYHYIINRDVSVPTLNLLALHKAITNLDKKNVHQTIQFEIPTYSYKSPKVLDALHQQLLVNHILLTDNALHRAIKKALTATGQQLEDAKAIIHMLIDVGADISQQNTEGKTALQLAAANPEIMTTIRQALVRKDLINATTQADRATVDKIIADILQQGYNVQEFLNTSYGTDTPLVHALKGALYSPTDNPQFERYMHIAQTLIDRGATLSNSSGRAFIDRYSKLYREKLTPYLTI